MFPLVEDVPHLTTEQMVEVDRVMMEDYGISLVQMMENAGRNLAHLARVRFLGGNPAGKTVAVLAGSGGNGGGAMVCARHLHNWGARVRVFLTKPPDALIGVPALQMRILRRMGVPTAEANSVGEVQEAALIADGIIGYSLSGTPRGAAADLIRWANGVSAPILSLDVPSGLDATTGIPLPPTVRAAATLTLALPKEGLRADGAEPYVGELYLGDIGVPPELYAGMGLEVGNLFAESDIVRLR